MHSAQRPPSACLAGLSVVPMVASQSSHLMVNRLVVVFVTICLLALCSLFPCCARQRGGWLGVGLFARFALLADYETFFSEILVAGFAIRAEVFFFL